MAAVAKSWIDVDCPECKCRRVFLRKTGWLFVCSVCGSERTLDPSGILAA
jgi:hypothetical protein